MNEDKVVPKQNWKSTLLILLIIFLSGSAYWALSQRNLNLPTEPDAPAGEEEEGLTDLNKQLLEQAENAQVKPVPPITAADHNLGSISAPVQLIVYSDFECPFCAQFAETMNTVKEEFGDQVLIAFRHFTLRSHPNAIPAAVAAECAAEQGKFWEMHDLLFANSLAGQLNDDQYKQNALELGLEPVRFDECLGALEYQDKVAAQMQEGRDAGVSGTPGGFVNGEPIPGAYPFEDFIGSDNRPVAGMKSIIERHLEKGGAAQEVE